MDIKQRIKEKRQELNLNQAELAKRAGLQAPSISQYENGIRNPSYEALIKLANALNTTTDYLVSGTKTDQPTSLDGKSKIFLKLFQNLSSSKKEKLMEYALITANQNILIETFSPDPKEYAKTLYENYLDKKLPVDLYRLADKLGLTIIKGDLERKTDALLLKTSNTIILSQKISESRTSFAIASLIGHSVMPWHTEPEYIHRKNGSSTLASENPEKVEANTFATNLLAPPEELDPDLKHYKTSKATIGELEDLAANKYKASFNMICNRLVESFPNRFAIIKSKTNQIDDTFSIDLLTNKEGTPLNENSIAFKLLEEQSQEKVVREGFVPANAWIENAKENEEVFESSVFTPDYESVFTLITKFN
ncbi:XRE family transcriptional regulator (plasmid) [Metaplanococcus flavidus]